tara:strand:- start:783 stop:2081 length:1299 start_codon:yes stop_codon:yes gene_type:complete
VWWSGLISFNQAQLHSHSKKLLWPVALYLATCLWVFVQWAPWIPRQFADPIWQSAQDILARPLPGRISVNPEATISGLMHLLVYGCVFWLTFQLTNSSSRAWAAIRFMAGVGCAYALYGIIIYMSGNGWILIYPKPAYENSLTSTFVNPNSFATFAGLTLLCATVVLLNHMKSYFSLKHPLRAKLVIIFEELVAKSALKTLFVLAISLALLLSSSRGGTASTFVGLLVLLLIYAKLQKLTKRQMAYAVAIFAIAASVIFTVSGNFLSKRLESELVDSSWAFRTHMYSLTWDAISTSPLKGTGFGTYADVITAFKDENNNAALQEWDKLHNTYIENALELGLPAALLLNLSIALVALRTAGGVATRKRDRLIPALGVSATVLVGLHSLVDFSLQIPAVTIFYAFVMGVSASQSWSQNRRASARGLNSHGLEQQ